MTNIYRNQNSELRPSQLRSQNTDGSRVQLVEDVHNFGLGLPEKKRCESARQLRNVASILASSLPFSLLRSHKRRLLFPSVSPKKQGEYTEKPSALGAINNTPNHSKEEHERSSSVRYTNTDNSLGVINKPKGAISGGAAASGSPSKDDAPSKRQTRRRPDMSALDELIKRQIS